VGIELYNNKSKVYDNRIEKSHENGIKVVGDNGNTSCTPKIWENKIFSCGFNGILCMG
jgi:hypothetical protein